MVNKVFAKKLLFIAMTFIILICTSGCGEDEEGVYKSETKALLKLSNEIKKSGEAFISSDKEERDLLIKLHKAYYEGKAGYDKARDKGYKIAEIKFKKENDKQDRRLTKQERTLRYVERRTSPEAAAQKEMSVAKNELMRSIETAYKKHFLDYNNFIAYTEMIIKQQKDESKINKAFETHPYSYAIPQKDIVFNEIQSKDTNEVQDTSVNYKDKETRKQDNSVVLPEKEAVAGQQKQPVQANKTSTVSDKAFKKVVGTITGNDVNVRKGPSVDYTSLGVFFKGDKVRIVDSNTNSLNETWYKIEFDNPKVGLIVGWVRSDFIIIN